MANPEIPKREQYADDEGYATNNDSDPDEVIYRYIEDGGASPMTLYCYDFERDWDGELIETDDNLYETKNEAQVEIDLLEWCRVKGELDFLKALENDD